VVVTEEIINPKDTEIERDQNHIMINTKVDTQNIKIQRKEKKTQAIALIERRIDTLRKPHILTNTRIGIQKSIQALLAENQLFIIQNMILNPNIQAIMTRNILVTRIPSIRKGEAEADQVGLAQNHEDIAENKVKENMIKKIIDLEIFLMIRIQILIKE
jgi:hypothetical protein